VERRGGVEAEGTVTDIYGYICIIKRQIIKEKEDQGYRYHGEVSSIWADGLFLLQRGIVSLSFGRGSTFG
jgi:hypothetical protein